MNESEYFLWACDGEVATITFNRPHKRNGLDLRVMRELEALLLHTRDETDAKVLIVTGSGTAFCAGADFNLVRKAETAAERRQHEAEMAQVPRLLGRLYDTMMHMDIISVAAVNGYAIGGGWSFALGFDHVIAVHGAQFWLPEVELGQGFRGFANVNLTQRLGPVLAKEAMILGRRFSAEELLALRVINQVCAPDALLGEARKTADAYLARPWRAVLSTRREINTTLYGPQLY